VTKEKRPEVRANRHAKKVKVSVWGWKVWVVWEPGAKLPLAIRVDDINVSDNEHALEVIQQARDNLEGYATLRSVAIDRGFLDGKLLWGIEHKDMWIYIPGKANLTITQEARKIARQAMAEHALGRTVDGCCVRERHQTITRGSGKNVFEETLTTVVVGVRELACDWWAEEGSDSKSNSKSFKPKLLNATVVMRWDGATKDAEKEVVILTNDPSRDPFVAFDAYDNRSHIENSCNREAKETWFLEHHPKRSEAGMRVHTYFVFLCMALVTAFRMHKAKVDEAQRRGQDLGMTRYRRQLERKNRDKVAVFIGNHFGVFRTWEVMLLLGIKVREREMMGETTQSVLARYGARLPNPG
jgi:hypothetical protein